MTLFYVDVYVDLDQALQCCENYPILIPSFVPEKVGAVVGALLKLYLPLYCILSFFFCPRRHDKTQVLELLRGLVKVSSSVARNYSTSHLSDMRTGGSANYDDLSLISAQFLAEVGRWGWAGGW